MRRLAALAMGLALLAAPPAAGNSFRTPEYRASTGLESMNTAKAYALGFTGKGVTVGVVDDSFSTESGEFAGKFPYGTFLLNDTGDNIHGIHVGGIIAAAKNDYGMHGAAFDATLLPVASEPPGAQGWKIMKRMPEATIINNSWAVPFHLDATYYPGFWLDYLAAFADDIDLAHTLVSQDRLVIMGAANDGHLGPSAMAGLPTMLDQVGIPHNFSNNWLNVAAYNPAYAPSHPAFIWTSTNLGLDASAYTLLAPGVNIYSTIGPDSYGLESGTSMAAPHVAGVAALVQEAFPYMGGKQLADVLLSTATPLQGANQPPYIVLMRETYNDDAELVNTQIIAYSAGQVTASAEQKLALLEELDKYSPWDEESTRYLLDQALAFPQVMSQEEYDSLFGQGMVNAGKAVRGPGLFDAARLDPGRDVRTFAGNAYAMYQVNTLGFDSVWSNDIGERRALSGSLAGLGVGLAKDGAGVLHLTGANSYSGPTEVRGGGISLGASWKGSGGSLAGDVYVRDQGIFTGAGTVGGNLHSSGILVPGFANAPSTSLSVGGSVRSRGRVHIILGQRGLANSLSARSMDLSGSTLSVGPASGRHIQPYADYRNVLRAGQGISGLASLPATIQYSPFLRYSLESRNGRSLSLLAVTRDLDSLPGLPSETRDVASALQRMFANRQGQSRQRSLDYLYNLQRRAFEHNAASLRGDLHAATLSSLPFSGMLRELTTPTRRLHRQEPGSSAFNLASGPGGMEVWMRPLAGYSGTDGRGSIYQENTVSRMRGLAVGLQRERDDLLAGALFAFGDGTVEHGDDEAEIIDVRVGLYAAYTPGALRLSGLLSGGWQFYDTTRFIPTAKGRDYVKSRFEGYSLGLGLEASCNVLHELSASVALSPHVGFDLDYVRQQSRREHGHRDFALDLDAKDYWRTTVNPGLRLDYSPAPWLTLQAGAGYKRLLSGRRPTLDAGFRGDSSHRFRAIGKDEGRNFVTYSLGAEAALPRNVTLAARFFGENSSRARACSGYVTMLFEW